MASPYVRIMVDYTAITHIFQGIIFLLYGFIACLASQIGLGMGIICGAAFDIIKGYILLKAIVQAQARLVKIFLILFILTILLQLITVIVFIALYFGVLHVAGRAIIIIFAALLFGYEALLYYYCQQHYQNLLMNSVITSA